MPRSFGCGTAYPTLGKKIEMMKKNRRRMNKKDPKGSRILSVAPSKDRARHNRSIHLNRAEIIVEPFQSIMFGVIALLLGEHIQGAQ